MWRAFLSECDSEVLVRQLLLSYLQMNSAWSWPGGDGMTEDDALSCYPNALSNGEVPDTDELCRRHPDLKSAIATFFSMRQW